VKRPQDQGRNSMTALQEKLSPSAACVPRHALSLHHLTALELTPVELVSLAATLGCDAVCLFSYLGPLHAGRWPSVDSPGAALEVRRHAQEAGICICNVEVFSIGAEFDLGAMLPGLDRAAILGATRATVHIRDSDEARAAAHLAEFCAAALPLGISAGVEFTGFSQARTIGDAARIIALSGARNAGIVADILHVVRGGVTLEDLARHAHRITYAQICDGSLTSRSDDYYHEAVENREIPGRGEFPLEAFVDLLDPDTPISVEVPLHRMRDAGIAGLDRARLAVDGSRMILERHRTGQIA
jgi:sugar phosphate isomerase/epimerase